MKRKRFSVEQIVAVLKQAELGMPVADLIRQVGISEQTFYRWRKQYAGMQSDQVRELKQLQEEEHAAEEARRRAEPGQGDSCRTSPQKTGAARVEAARSGAHPALLRNFRGAGQSDKTENIESSRTFQLFKTG